MHGRPLLGLLAFFLAGHAGAAALDDGIQRSFLQGIQSLQSGDHARAETIFRKLLLLTGSPRIKLELARSLFYQRKYAESKSLFREVLSDTELPWRVRDNIEAFIRNIENADGYLKFSVSIVSDSNPRSLSTQRAFSIGGLRLTYVPPADNRRVTGFNYYVAGLRPLSGEHGVSAYFTGSLVDYPGLSVDRLTVDAGLIKHLGSHFSIKTGIESGAFGGSHLYSLPYLALMPVFWKADSSGANGELKIGRLDFPDYSYLDSVYKSASISGYRTISQRIAGSLTATLERSDSPEKPYSYRGASLNPSVIMFFSQPALLVRAGISAGSRQYDGVDPFFGLQRSDIKKRFDLYIKNKKWRWRNSSPAFVLSLEKNRSNITFFEYRKINLSIILE